MCIIRNLNIHFLNCVNHMDVWIYFFESSGDFIDTAEEMLL